MNLTQHSKPT